MFVYTAFSILSLVPGLPDGRQPNPNLHRLQWVNGSIFIFYWTSYYYAYNHFDWAFLVWSCCKLFCWTVVHCFNVSYIYTRHLLLICAFFTKKGGLKFIWWRHIGCYDFLFFYQHNLYTFHESIFAKLWTIQPTLVYPFMLYIMLI